MADKKLTREEKKQLAREVNAKRRERMMNGGGGRRGRGGPPGMPADKANDFGGTLKKLVRFMGRYRFAIIVVWIFAIASTIFNIIGPKILGNATTELYKGLMAKIGGTGAIAFDTIAHILLIALSIYVISALCNFIQGWIMAGVSQRIAFEFREGISKKIHKLPLKYFETRTDEDDGRCPFENHKRRRYARTGIKPERNAACNKRYDINWRSHHDAYDKPSDDADYPGNSSVIYRTDEPHNLEVSEVLHKPAELPRSRKRTG